MRKRNNSKAPFPPLLADRFDDEERRGESVEAEGKQKRENGNARTMACPPTTLE